jgi:hypothetical protein
MTDPYLWDRSGDVDPDVARLEDLLRPLGHQGRPLVRPITIRPADVSTWWRVAMPLALAATVVFLVGGIWVGQRVNGASWTVEPTAGHVNVGGRVANGRRALSAGDRLEIGEGGGARLRADGVGTIELGPRTRLRVIDAGTHGHLFALDTGQLNADVSAPPGVFAVQTPAARAIDLGCRYSLQVGEDGAGVLEVTLGWVGLAGGGRESLVPAGARCATRSVRGPGTPWFEGASPGFVAALKTLDGPSERGREAALAILLTEARPLDAITLWHLLTRLDRSSAERVYDRLTALVPLSAGIRRVDVLSGSRAALAALWEEIGLGDLDVLRTGMARMR